MNRKHERTEVIKEIVLESTAGGRPSRISDMSIGGCYIESINNYRAGETLQFDLKNTAGVALRFSGRVAYVLEGFGFGLSFINLTQAHLNFLRDTLPEAPAPISDSAENLLELW